MGVEMKKGWVIAAVGVLLVVAIGAAVLYFPQLFGVPKDASGSPPGQTDTALESDAGQVADLIGSVAADPSSAVSEELASEADLSEALPPGSKVAPMVETWAPDGFGGGTMNATMSVPGQPDERYLVVVVETGEGWKIIGTFEQEAQP